MLRSASLTSSVALATEVAINDKVVTAVPATPLFELVRATNTAVTGMGGCNPSGIDMLKEVENLASDLDYHASTVSMLVTSNDVNKITEHDALLDSFISELAVAARGHISFARNVANPVIAAYGDNLLENLRNTKIDSGTDFNVIQVGVPDYMFQGSFQDEVLSFGDKIAPMPGNVLYLDALGYEEIVDTLSVGDTTVDAGIRAWLSTKDSDELVANFNDIFGGNGDSFSYKTIEQLPLFEAIETFGLVFLTARKVFTKATLAKQGQTLDQVGILASDVRDWAAASLKRLLARLDLYDRTGLVIISKDAIRKTVTVYNKNYQIWTKDRSVETIFGTLLVGTDVTTLKQLDDNSVALDRAWKQHVTLSAADLRIKKFETFKKLVKTTYLFQPIPLDVHEEEYVNLHPEFMAGIEKRLDEEVAKLTIRDMECVYDVALRVICRVRFYYTSAEEILSFMRDISEAADGKIEPREAGLIAAIKYVASYIGTQMKLA